MEKDILGDDKATLEGAFFDYVRTYILFLIISLKVTLKHVLLVN
jgi:hypothetical protein